MNQNKDYDYGVLYHYHILYKLKANDFIIEIKIDHLFGQFSHLKKCTIID